MTMTCAVDCCKKKHDSHGFCSTHASRWLRRKSAFGPYPRARVAQGCSVEGCTRRNSYYGLCVTHHKWQQRTGDPAVRPATLFTPRQAVKGKPAYYQFRVIHNHPFMGSGRVLEHRIVMSEILGRALLPHENVHHINGERKDNRPENLELWTVLQPPGQRVEDKIAYALEILATYKPEVLKEGI